MATAEECAVEIERDARQNSSSGTSAIGPSSLVEPPALLCRIEFPNFSVRRRPPRRHH